MLLHASHDAAVVVAIIVVAAAAAVTCLHIEINSEVQTMMQISNTFDFTTNKNRNRIKVGPIHLFGFLQGLIVQLQQCMIPVFANNMMTVFIDSFLGTACIIQISLKFKLFLLLS